MPTKHIFGPRAAALFLALGAPVVSPAEVLLEPISTLVVPAPPPLASPAGGLAATVAAAFAPTTRATRATTDVLLLPYFEVEPEDPLGFTTLFAVRNETADPVAVRVLFLSAFGPTQQQAAEFALPGHGVQTFNLRDVTGLRADGDGVARGLAVLGVIGGGPEKDYLTGDFFFVRGLAEGGEATGGALLNLSVNDPDNELCQTWSTRFLNGGPFQGTTTLTVVVDLPSGVGGQDPPTLIATAYAEDGEEVARFAVKSDQNAFQLEVRDLVPAEVPFGSLSVEFQGTRGAVLVEHSAAHGQVVGLKGACLGGG